MQQVLDRLDHLGDDGREVAPRITARLNHRSHQVQPRRRHHALGYVAAMLAVFASASTLISDMHARGPRDGAMIVASR